MGRVEEVLRRGSVTEEDDGKSLCERGWGSPREDGGPYRGGVDDPPAGVSIHGSKLDVTTF